MERRSKYTKEILTEATKSCISIADMLRYFSLKVTGGNYRHLSGLIKYHLVDISHFKGKLWSKGLTKENHPSIKKWSDANKLPDNLFFSENSYPAGGTRISKRMREKGFEYKCNKCNLDSWLGNPITLHVDHINGKHTDNRLENLRFLCPNCHQQTDTWGNKCPGG